MKRFATIFAALLLATSARAGPLDWMKRQVRDHPVRTKLVAATISSAIYAKGLQHCRAGDVERCDEHYGAAWGGFGTTVALNFVMIPISQKIGGKQGDALSYGSSFAVLGHGIYQWRNYETKPDLSSVAFIRH
jgi:hypothetical protein